MAYGLIYVWEKQKNANFKNYLYKYPYDKNWSVVFSDPKNDTRRMHLLITKRSNDHEKNKEFQNEIKIIKDFWKIFYSIRITKNFFTKI